MAWILRRFPFFAQIGDGQSRLQPVSVDDLAEIACRSVYQKENSILDVTGPDTWSFDDLVRLVGRKIGCPRPVLHFPAGLALQAARFLSLFIGDVLITRDEVRGLMSGLLVSSDPPSARRAFRTGWKPIVKLSEGDMPPRSPGITGDPDIVSAFS